MANVVGERFQITIDKHVREQLGIKPGDQAVEWVDDGQLVVAFLPAKSESMLGILKKLTDTRIEPITDWQALYDKAWEARARELDDVLEADSKRHGTRRTRTPRTRTPRTKRSA